MMYRFGAARPTELTDELSARFEGLRNGGEQCVLIVNPMENGV